MLQGLPVGAQTTQGYQSAPSSASQWAGLGTTALGGLGLLNNAGALSGIKNLFSGSNNDNSAPTGPAYDGQANVDSGYQAPNVEESKGGVIKSYASGGLVTLALDRAMRGTA